MAQQQPPRIEPERRPNDPSSNQIPRRSRFGFLYAFIGIFLVLALVQVIRDGATSQASYDEFVELLESGYLEWVIVGDEEHRALAKLPTAEWDKRKKAKQEAAEKAKGPHAARVGGKLSYKEQGFTFRVTSAPEDDTLIAKLEKAKTDHGTVFDRRPHGGLLTLMFMWMFPLLIIVGLWFFLMRQSGQMGKAALSFGKSRAKLYGEKIKSVCFEDVAGCEEAKEELTEVVDFLKDPKKYQRLGARIPKGILLVGPPGTGKTLLARAVAGEAAVPFFSLSGSDFVEMFVGVGAARVRDLFDQGKKRAPCIIFIDELDAVGRQRGTGLGGGHDEREQTLNQLLVEMDGFDTMKGVILLAATNRPDVLDPALLRPGRFDRQVVIDAPDAKGRQAILQVHSHTKKVHDEIDFEALAANTPGFTGADLANVMNEAALLAARKGKDKVSQPELDEAVERSIAGPERKSRRLGPEERRRVAYHEAGHALVAALSEHADPVRKISIVPRGHAALGYTMQAPTDDRYLITRSALFDQLKGLLAGRAAEQLIFSELSTGASDDLKRATRIARSMVCRFGMSDKLGPVTFGLDHQPVFLGRDLTQEERNYSEASAHEIDNEVRSIIRNANEAAKKILTDHQESLVNIAERLLEREVIQGDELEEMLKEELAALKVESGPK